MGHKEPRRKEVSRKRAELKASLMKEGERVIEELLDWSAETAEPSLGQIEEVVLKLRQELSEKMAVGVVSSQEAVRPVPGPLCEGCGEEMRYKGTFPKQVSSWVGEVKLERGYYSCGPCQRGLFPPG